MLVVFILAALFSQLGTAEKRTPVFISGDTDLITYCELISGSGTREDPYVLAGLRIDASSADYGLYIENVSAHLLIRNCEIFGAINPYARGGIVLSNCSRVTIERCSLHDNKVGVEIAHCTGAIIAWNRIINNQLGITLDLLSRGNTIVGNYFENARNAAAFAPNRWANEEQGNCWSDYSGAYSTYRISDSNIDFLPCATPGCPYSPPPAVDTTPPVIRMSGDSKMFVEVDSGFEDPGAVGWDDRDGDLGAITPQGEVIMSVFGTYKLEYVAVDSAGNVTKAIRTVIVRDTIAPEIILMGDEVIHVEIKTDFIDPGVKAIDNYDGDIGEWVKPVGNVDTMQLGSYRLTYTAVDSSGNQSPTVYRTVRVEDTTPPDIELSGENPDRVELGDVYEDPGATAKDNYDGDLTKSVMTEGLDTVDTSTTGAYKVTYYVTDSSGNISPRLDRTVIVGWPESITDGSISGAIESIEIGSNMSTMSIRVSETTPIPSKHEYPLQLAELLFRAKEVLPQLSNSDLGFEILDNQGKVMMAVLPATVEIPSLDRALPIVLFDKLKVEDYRRESCIDYRSVPVTTTDSQQRIRTAIKPVLDQHVQVSIQVVQVLLINGNIGYQVSLSYKTSLGANNEPPKLSDVRESVALLELAAFLALARRAVSISVTVYLDLYGIIYRNVLDLSLATASELSLIGSSHDIRSNWNERLVHPLLQ